MNDKIWPYKAEEGAGEKLIELNRKTCEDETREFELGFCGFVSEIIFR